MLVISNESSVVVVVIVVAPVISVAAFSLTLPVPEGSKVKSALLELLIVDPINEKSPNDTSANDNVPDPSVFKNWFADPSDVGNASPDNVACHETLNVPSTISPSLMLIDDESLELKVVPRTVIESNIIFPVPDVEIVKSEFVGATIFCIDMSPSLLNSSADPAAFTFRTWPAEPIAVKPVPPKEVPTVSPDWNSAIPVATLDALKTTRTGVLSAIS